MLFSRTSCSLYITHKCADPQKSVQRYNKKCTYARKQAFFLKKDRFIYRQCYFTAHREFTHRWAVECIACNYNHFGNELKVIKPLGSEFLNVLDCISSLCFNDHLSHLPHLSHSMQEEREKNSNKNWKYEKNFVPLQLHYDSIKALSRRTTCED